MKDEVSFENIRAHDLDEAYELYRECLFEFINQTFGWTEDFQRNRFQSTYPIETLFWAVDGQEQRIGLIGYSKTEKTLHLSLLLLYKTRQGSGFGKQIMDNLERLAGADFRITLSTFKVNQRALSFYERRGYLIEGHDQYFYEMAKSMARS